MCAPVCGGLSCVAAWYIHAPIVSAIIFMLCECSPQIFGMFLVKLATALMLIGGLHRVDDSGTHIRGEVHMLLIGDPGTGGRLCSGQGAQVWATVPGVVTANT